MSGKHGKSCKRTYVSTLERGIKSPTSKKVEQLSKVLEVHPLTVMVIAYLYKENAQDLSSLLKSIENEVNALQDR